MPRKGNCYDNSVMENFFGGLKTEIYYGFEKKYSSFNAFAVSIEEYINYYNNRRIKKKQNGGPCKIQGRIYVFSLINNIIYGQEKWVYIKKSGWYSFIEIIFVREETICWISKQGIRKQKLEK